MMSVILMANGIFIVFEGGEGSGKSSQIRRLTGFLKKNKIGYIVTREPGGSSIGAGIRRILLNPRHKKMSPRAELMLYEADRAQHAAEVVRPALKTKRVVISDRHADSSTVYQGICRGLGISQVEILNKFATGGLKPDLVIVLDLPEKIGFERIRERRPDRLELERRSFHRKVRQGYLQLAKRELSRFAVVDASQSKQHVAKAIESVVKKVLKRRQLWRAH